MPEYTNGTNNNSSYNNFTIKTNGLNLFGADDNMLMISYLDDSISLSFCYPSIDETGKKTFPKDNRITTTLRRDTVAEFAEILRSESFLSAVENEGTFNKGVALNRQMTDILSIIVEGKNIGLSFFKELGEDHKPKSIFIFRFQKSKIINGFNGRTDEFAIDEMNAPLFMFVHMITAFEETCATKLGGHMAKLGLSWSASKEMEYLRAIASKLGISIENNSYGNRNGGGGWNNAQRYPDAQSSQDANAMSGQMQQINDLGGFIQ